MSGESEWFYLNEVARLVGELREAIDSYQERFDPELFRNAAPLLKDEMDDVLDAVDDRLTALRRPQRTLSDVIKDAAQPGVNK